MLLMYAEVPVNVVGYDSGSEGAAVWFGNDKPALKDKNALINLPYIIDGDTVISQSNACLSYLGRKYGLWGDSPLECANCDQLLCEIMDLRNKMTAVGTLLILIAL